MKNTLCNIFEYLSFQCHNPELSTWIILGKGPSFSKLKEYDLSHYRILTLNDAVREVTNVDIAHFIDFDAFERCASIAIEHAKIIVLPWFPHFNNKAGTTNLAELTISNHPLSSLAEQGRLYWYDLSSSSVRCGTQPVISATFFSAEAALDLLATAGIKSIRSLGVDGGDSYGKEFLDLTDISCLSNNQKNFDRQFESFSKIIARTGVDYSPLDIESPIRVYVAATASESLPVKVLEYSIKQHCSTTVHVMPLCDANIEIPVPTSVSNRSRTPFSFQRFLIPKIQEYTGRAIYLDSDMLLFKDIRQLWNLSLGDSDVLTTYSESASGRKPQFSVMLLDCNKLTWEINEIVSQLNSGTLNYKNLMYDFTLAKTRAAIGPRWNALETYKHGSTALLHYTDMNTQPWVSHINPLGYLWVATLRRAIQDEAISTAFVEAEVLKGHVRPSLIYQLKHDIDDSLLLSKSALILDQGYVAPYRSILTHKSSSWRNKLFWLRAYVRAIYYKSFFYHLVRRNRY